MRLRLQVLVGVALAIGLVAGLQWWVSRPAAQAAEPAPATRIGPPAPDLAADSRGLIESLHGTARRFHLAPQDGRLPDSCAPILQVRPGGAVRIPVAPPVAMLPGPAVWEDVGILLPRARIADLSPSERSSLLAIWSALLDGRPLRADRVLVHGCVFAPGELDLLRRWMR